MKRFRMVFALVALCTAVSVLSGSIGCGKKEKPPDLAPAGKAPADPDEPMPRGGPPK